MHTSTMPVVPSQRPCWHHCQPFGSHGSVISAARLVRCSAQQPKDVHSHARPLAVGLAALVAAGLAHFSPPAYAEIETVSAASATTMAKPLKEQKVDKEKVWLIFILGAAGLFGGTLLLENNERFFPAIYRANLAMSQAKKAAKAKTQVQEVIDVDGGETRMQSAVEAGLSEASRRQSSQQGTTSSASPAKEASEPQQQFQPSSLGEQSGLLTTSDEQLQAAIKELRSQRHDPNHDDSESSNGSKQRETSAVASDGPNKGQK